MKEKVEAEAHGLDPFTSQVENHMGCGAITCLVFLSSTHAVSHFSPQLFLCRVWQRVVVGRASMIVHVSWHADLACAVQQQIVRERGRALF